MIKTYKKHTSVIPAKAGIHTNTQPSKFDFKWLWEIILERKILVFSVLFLLVTLPIFLLVIKYQSKIEAAWMDDAWSYRKAIAIPSHTALETNVYVTVPTFDATDTSKFQADCGDLRFTKQNGEQLPYYVVDCDATANIHVQFDTLSAGASTYYMYYGNSSVANGFSSADFATAATGLGTQTLAAEEKSQGPVAYWKFNEGYGTSIKNSSQYNYPGTLGSTAGTDATAPTWATEDQCISGKCLKFNGTTDAADFDDYDNLPALQFDTGNWSVSAWIRAPSGSSKRVVFGLRTGSDQDFNIGINTSDKAYVEWVSYPGHSAYSTTASSSSVADNKWHQIAAKREGGTITLYVDGVLVGTDSTVGSYDITGPGWFSRWTAGAWFNGCCTTFDAGVWQYFFKGFIDDVKIYSYARTAAQIKSDFASKGSGSVKGTSASLGSSVKNSDAFSNGLVGYWKSDEVSGNGSDSSGNGNTSTVSGSNNYGVGKFGNGLRSGVATTNVDTNPSIETGTSGWSCWANSGTGTCVRSTDTAAFGQYSFKSTMSVSGSLGHWAGLSTASPSTTYTVSGYVNVTSFGGSNFAIYMREVYPTGNGQCGSNLYTVSAVTNGWVRFSGTCTTRADTTSLGLSYYLNNTGQIVYVDGVQIEAGSTVTPYLDGSLGTGYSWSGTAHASTSTRTASAATNATLLNNTTGSLSFWFNSPSLDTTAQCPLGSSTGDSTGGLFFGLKSTGVYLNHNYATSQNVTPQYVATINNNTWNHVVYTWDNPTLKGNLYVNGTLQQNVSYSQTITIGEYIQNLGTCTRTGYSAFNGTLDDIRNYNRALSPVEVRALYSWAPGPVGYWSFDEKTGQSAYDKSGNSNNGTLGSSGGSDSSDPTWTQGKFGGGLNFDGSNDYVDAGAGSSIQLSKTGTVSLWFKATSAFSGSTGVAKFLMWGGPREFYFSASSSKLFYFLSDDATYVVSDSGSWDTNWHHVEVTSDGTTVYMYIDGVRQTQTASLGALNFFSNGSNLTIGRSSTSFPGKIDDVKIYNYARTSGQIIEDLNAGHPLGGSPVGSQRLYLKFDEGYGTTPKDSSSYGLNGALNGSVSWSNDGKFGKALDFDGSTGYVSFATQPVNWSSRNRTISMWVRPESSDLSGVHDLLVGYDTSYTYSRMRLRYNSAKINFQYIVYPTPITVTMTSSTTLIAGSWYYVTVTWDDTKYYLYINGKQESTYSDSSVTTDNVTLTTLGSNQDTGDPATYSYGLIDEVKVYYAAITEDEIKLDYNHGSAMVLGSTSTTSAGEADNSATGEYCVPGSTDSCSAPIGEWKMDEKTGGYAYDTSGNGNTGTITGATWSTGKVGSALSFNGSNNYIDAGSNSSFEMTDEMTIEFWMYPETQLVDYARPISRGGWQNKGWTIYTGAIGSNVLYPSFGSDVGWSGSFAPAITYTPNTWNFITVTVKLGSSGKSYINGRYINSQAPATYYSGTTRTLRIGDENGSRFKGKIDQVRIYNYARTPAQIAYDYNRGAPVGWWKMDECQGGNANDSSGNGNTGTITIGATGSQTAVGTCTTSGTAWYNGVTGKYNSSLNFDGTDDYIYTADSPSIDMGTMTISAWIKTGTSTTQYISERNNATYYFATGVTSQKLCMYLNTVSSNWDCSTKSVTDGSWHHVVSTWDGTNKRLYIDGFLDSTFGGAGGNIANAAVGINIGVRITGGTPSGYFNGQIDDVKIFNYALTANQVKTLNNQGSAIQFAPATGSP